ncbi:MAG: NAD-dependent succinate-semialdehyde dehydrogenase [Deltaproteobacteria bacterium]|nr:NAD-dependent succinate-semialdehyde dehydrogenase [Deltaproteobacteria bacterium]
MAIALHDPTLLRTQAFLGGTWAGADSGATFAVRDPADGEELARVPRCGAAETRRAIAAAAAVQPGWRACTALERARVLRRFHDLLVEHEDDLGMLITREQGKPLAEARAEIAYAAGFFGWFAEEARRVQGETIPAHRADARIVVVREPIGVGAGITPWNFPAAMIARKIAPALAVGCAIVVKPAEATPLTALAIAELAARAGLPVGLLSVVTGAAEDAPVIGAELAENPIVRALSFTGSTEVGRLLMAQCAPTVKRVSLELGGNAPFLVFDDADLAAAVEGVIASKFRNAGQTCVCANRILVQDGVHDRFVAALAERIRALRVARGTEAGAQIGPLIDEDGLAKVERHVADATARGARVLVGGQPHALGGTFYEPTLLIGVGTGMLLAQEETFGPVAGILRFRDETEAVRIANDTPFGLAAYFYARDAARAWRVSEALEYGMVGINTGMVSTEVAPFGGMKQSGIGREGSRQGVEEWLETKYLCWGGLS